MADEIIVSGIGDLIASQVLAAEYLYLLADREDFFGHPALMYAGAAQGSNVVKVSDIGLMGYDLLSAGTEPNALANTALTDASDTVTVAWYGKTYQASDIARAIAGDRLAISQFVADAAVSVAQTLVSLLTALASGYSTSVGVSGADATWANFVDAISQLEVNKALTSRALWVGHPQQWGDLMRDNLSLGGAAQHRADMQSVIMQRMSQYKGNFFGVDCFTSSTVATANGGADRAGMMITRGAALWADAAFPLDGNDGNIIPLGRAALERSRTGPAGLTNYTTHAFLGVAEGIDTAGVSFVTDA